MLRPAYQTVALLLFVAFAITPVIVFAGDQSPEEIIRSAIFAIDSHYLYARSNPLWFKARERLLHAAYNNAAEVYQSLIREVATVGDSELNVLSKNQLLELQQDAAGERVGIGLVAFSIDTDPDGAARIVTPIFGTPAAEAGVRAKDVLERVNGRPTKDMTHEEVIDELRRKARGVVTLNLRRGQHRFRLLIPTTDAKLVPVQVQSVKSAGGTFGYIRIVEFTPESGQLVRLAVSKLESESVRAYILDLRNNPGGALSALIAAASAFRLGPFGSTVHVDGDSAPVESTEAVLTNKPIVVLTNEGTASAAEVLTAALEDQARATVVGATSYGRGQAQTYYPLTEGYGVVVPSALMRTPTGKEFKGSGLKPDIEVAQNPPTLRTVATQEDPAFVRAVDILSRSRESQ